jgi:hypothetical protein
MSAERRGRKAVGTSVSAKYKAKKAAAEPEVPWRYLAGG